MECPKAKFTTMNAVLYGPLSCGWTHITSVDPFFEAPALDPVYYAHRLDFETQCYYDVNGIELCRRIL